MKLHVFNDPRGFFLNLVVNKFREKNGLADHIFINLNNKTIHKNGFTQYLNGRIPGFQKKIRELPVVEMVSFYPLDYHAAYFLKELKRVQPAIKVNWIFWSYEFYHQPHLYPRLLDAFSLAYYQKRNSFGRKVIAKLKKSVKRILGIPVFSTRLMLDSYKYLEGFYSFLPQDFRNIFTRADNLSIRYHPISLITIEEMTKDLQKAEMSVSPEIMVGHAGTPTANHKEILDRLVEMKIPHNIFIPLQYGEEDYGAAIKEIALSRFGNKVQFLERRLSIGEYSQRLASIGFAIFNFRSQEALANILFLIWNGAKVFLREESSAYRQFKDWGVLVFTVDHDLNEQSLRVLMTGTEKTNNRTIVEGLFSEKKVSEYWESLM